MSNTTLYPLLCAIAFCMYNVANSPITNASTENLFFISFGLVGVRFSFIFYGSKWSILVLSLGKTICIRTKRMINCFFAQIRPVVRKGLVRSGFRVNEGGY